MARNADEIAPAGKWALSIPEAVALSGLSRSHLYRQMENGGLAAVKIGKRRLILADTLKAWLQAAPAVATRPAA